ncbi:MAG: dual specificity protein phosphatase family protein [Promethearchaeia archaeon]
MARLYKIASRLYISSYRAAKKDKRLKKAGITAVVNLMEKEKGHIGSEYNYLHKSLKDEKYIEKEDLKDILEFIDRNIKNGKVLVHCHSGISRSGGIIIARLLQEHPQWNWDDAYSYVRKIALISPHPEIKKSILDYLEEEEGQKRE